MLTAEREQKIRRNVDYLVKNSPHYFEENFENLGDIRDLLDEIDRLREYKVHYDRLFEKSVVVPTDKYIENVGLIEKLIVAVKALKEQMELDDMHGICEEALLRIHGDLR